MCEQHSKVVKIMTGQEMILKTTIEISEKGSSTAKRKAGKICQLAKKVNVAPILDEERKAVKMTEVQELQESKKKH